MTTLREHLEAIRDANRVGIGNLRTWARFNEEHAVAALAILDDADVFYTAGAKHYGDPSAVHRMVPDPEPSA